MKKNINKTALMLCGLISLTVIGIVIRTVALFTAFDPQIEYFDESSLITYINRAFVLMTLLLGAFTAFTQKDQILTSVNGSSLLGMVASMLLGFAFIIFGGLYLLINLNAISPIAIAVAILAFVSAVYYIYEGIRPSSDIATGKTVLIIISAVLLAIISFMENFDLFVTLNNPEKLGFFFIFILGALFIIQKALIRVNSPRPRLFLFSAYATAYLGAYLALPGIIANFAGILDNTKYLVYYLLAFALSIYAFTAILDHVKSQKQQG